MMVLVSVLFTVLVRPVEQASILLLLLLVFIIIIIIIIIIIVIIIIIIMIMIIMISDGCVPQASSPPSRPAFLPRASRSESRSARSESRPEREREAEAEAETEVWRGARGGVTCHEGARHDGTRGVSRGGRDLSRGGVTVTGHGGGGA